MTYRVSELQDKEIVDIADGARYGYLADLEIDGDTGALSALVVTGQRRFLGLLGRAPEVAFPWSAIRRVGQDIILVDGGKRLPSGGAGRG